MSDVAVVVPVLNGRRTLPRCLEALVGQSLTPGAIYVVDNGSTDGTWEWLEEFAARETLVRVLRESLRGPGAVRNAGIRAAMAEGSARFLAFTDADCVAAPRWLQHLREGFDRDRVGAVTGSIRAQTGDSWVGRYLQLGAFDPGERDRLANSVGLGEGIAGGNACVRVRALKEAGLFDESLLVAQDWELGLRLLRAGWWIRYRSAARVDHLHHERSVRDLLALAAKYGRGRPSILARHFPGQILLSVFRLQVTLRGPLTASVRVSSPEKVVGGLTALALWRPWAFGLLAAYAAYLGLRIRSSARVRQVRGIRLWHLPGLVALQLAEAAVGNVQAFRDGLKRGVLCL